MLQDEENIIFGTLVKLMPIIWPLQFPTGMQESFSNELFNHPLQ